MSKTVTHKLIEPVPGHGALISEVVVREPTYADYITAGGEPYQVGQSEDGTLFSMEKPEIVWKYVELCLVEPKDSLLLERASWRDARAVRKLILDFFQAPAEASET